MSSTEPQHKENSKRLSSVLKVTSTHIKVAACAVLAAAIGVTGTFCLSGGLSSAKIMNRSLTEGFNSSAINPQYLEKVTRTGSEVKPTEPPTEQSTKSAKAADKNEKQTKSEKTDKKSDKDDKEKTTEKATEKKTEAETEKATDNIAPTDPTAAAEETIPSESTQSKPTTGESGSVVITDPETTAPTTEEESIMREALYQQQWDAGYLMAIDNPDYNYSPTPVKLSDKEYDLICRTVMREMGHQGYIGIAMVAQAFRDAMNAEGYDAFEVVKKFGYEGPRTMEPNQDTIDAVNFIFKENGSAVQHRLMFYYATWGNGAWHETQNFICQYGITRFFDRWY